MESTSFLTFCGGISSGPGIICGPIWGSFAGRDYLRAWTVQWPFFVNFCTSTTNTKTATKPGKGNVITDIEDITYPRTNVQCSFYYIDILWRRFWRFSEGFRRFFKTCPKVTRMFRIFPEISEDWRRLPKTFEKDPKMFRSFTNEFKCNLRDKLDIVENDKSVFCNFLSLTSISLFPTLTKIVVEATFGCWTACHW